MNDWPLASHARLRVNRAQQSTVWEEKCAQMMRLSGAFGRPLRCRRKLSRSRVRQVYAGPGSSAGNWPCNGTAPQQQAATAQAQPGVVLQAPEDGPCCDAARGW
ncbi:hypothetical protein VFPFJ_09013 [Purpureocillium lilacinum]|uniref:Uncharacterized protein n=1 Tax=Purpureocillium lilacinum TaxID=33203 RepID=A0A179GF23_PURLI|nr:hypothetical protein VFPFJ_09013 [Purpureocillium lilacinum]OAQ76060.1 hypothetical protein VFPBJ_08420 [Purpureocillium lilacinum]OAQ83210.1 hypothetical protein VFPFJ_09013 [Purpureocillium lilacinum]